MKLTKLGRKIKGKKYFNLVSPDQCGYKIKCTDKAGTAVFNNVLTFEWLHEGKQVFITPDSLKRDQGYDFTKYDNIVITKAKLLEEQHFEASFNEFGSEALKKKHESHAKELRRSKHES